MSQKLENILQKYKSKKQVKNNATNPNHPIKNKQYHNTQVQPLPENNDNSTIQKIINQVTSTITGETIHYNPRKTEYTRMQRTLAKMDEKDNKITTEEYQMFETRIKELNKKFNNTNSCSKIIANMKDLNKALQNTPIEPQSKKSLLKEKEYKQPTLSTTTL